MNGSCFFFCVLLFVIGVVSRPIAIDFGAENVKVSLVGGEIVLDSASSRKTDNYLGFRANERLFSLDARNLVARFPNSCVNALNYLVGTAPNSSLVQAYSFYLLNNYDLNLSTHEMLGMMFGYLKETAERQVEAPIREAVVTVPYFFSSRQRKAVIDSAAIGGLRVSSLIHSTSAGAQYFASQNAPLAHNQFFGIIDVGALKTEISFFQFYEKSRRKQCLKTVATIAKAGYGGRSFDFCIADLIRDKSKIQQEDIIHKDRIILHRAAQKVKEVLSANRMASFSVELSSGTLSGVISRDEFESRCSHLFTQFVDLFQQSLQAVNRSFPNEFLLNVVRIELIGGGVRIPKIGAIIEQVIGAERIQRTLNGDEAIVLGAALEAQRSSLVTKLRAALPLVVDEAFPFSPVYFSTGGVKQQLLKAKAPPQVRTISFNGTQDFAIRFYLSHHVSGDISSPAAESHLYHEVTAEIPAIFQTLRNMTYLNSQNEKAHQNNTHSVKVSVRLSSTSILTIDHVEIVAHVAVNRTKRIRVNKTAEEVAAEESEGIASDQQVSASKKVAKYKYVTTHKVEMRKRRITLPIDTIRYQFSTSMGFPLPINRTEASKARKVLREHNAQDKARIALAASRNELEAFLLSALGKEDASSNKETKLRCILDWLESGEGALDGTPKNAFEEKLGEAKAIAVNDEL